MDTAISYDLPELMTDYKRKKHGTGNANKMSTAKSKKWYTKKNICFDFVFVEFWNKIITYQLITG